MRRALLLAVCCAALVAAILAPAPSGWGSADWATPASPASSEQGADVAYRAVTGMVLGCPELPAPEGTANVLAGVIAPGRQVSSGSTREGAASLQPIDSVRDLARLPAVGEPVTLLVAGRSQPSILMQSSGEWAPDALAGVATHSVRGSGAGLASAACPEPGSSWWFLGAGSEPGRGSALLVSNPAPEPARFDLSVLARSGPAEALVGKGIDLGPRSSVRLRLDALVPDEELLAIQVRASSGRVAAALRDVAQAEGGPGGVDYLPPAQEPTRTLWIPGVPEGDGTRDLVLANPGPQFATVQLGLLSESGRGPLAGLPAIAVPARSVISTSVAEALAGSSGTLELISDVPITAAVRAGWGGSESGADLAWICAVPAVTSPNEVAGAAAVPAAGRLVTTVTIAAPAGPVSGTLQVIGTGSAAGSIFTRKGLRRAQDTDAVPEDVPRRGVAVVTGGTTAEPAIDVSVPAGAQRTVTIPGTDQWALAHVTWRSAPSSGPAVLSHVTVDPRRPLATGYSWWPVTSAVPDIPVREDVGTVVSPG